MRHNIIPNSARTLYL